MGEIELTNKELEPTALRAAADAERWTDPSAGVTDE